MHIRQRGTADIEHLTELINSESRAKQRDRYRMALLALKGWDAPRIAEALSSNRRTVQAWVYRYREEGIAGLRPRPLPGRVPKLPREREAQVWMPGLVKAMASARSAARMQYAYLSVSLVCRTRSTASTTCWIDWATHASSPVRGMRRMIRQRWRSSKRPPPFSPHREAGADAASQERARHVHG